MNQLLRLALAALIPLVASAADDKRPAGKPNIIFILADDVGLGDVGCSGGDQFKTPNIDALAKGGTRFTQCYAAPLCGPSRAMLMTGRYAFRTGMTGNQTGNALKPASEVMMPNVLKPAGYVTAEVGKWAQLPLQPGDWGFDEYLRFPGSGRYWRAQTTSYTLNGAQKDLPPNTYLPDLMHDFLIDFIQRHKDRPFYVHYAMSHAHGPIVRTPDSAPGTTDFYADNIAYMDKLVGRLVAELDRLGLREKTLIFFVGDNGTAPGRAARSTVEGRQLSGRKGTTLEGGSRVPMIVNWKGTTPEAKVLGDLVDFSDFFPTFAELAGADLPAGVTIDGRSLAAQIKGQPGAPREWAYVELNGKRYVRTARWKLNNAGELYDMKGAPFVETLVPADSTDAEAGAARKHLGEVLEKLVGKERAQTVTTPPPATPPSPDVRAQRRLQRQLRRQNAPPPKTP